jgi:hypothetical protein
MFVTAAHKIGFRVVGCRCQLALSVQRWAVGGGGYLPPPVPTGGIPPTEACYPGTSRLFGSMEEIIIVRVPM